MCVSTLLSDDYENTALFPPPANSDSGLLLGSVDPPWQPPGERDSHISAMVQLCGEAFSSSSSSSQSVVSEQAATLIQHQEHSCNRHYRRSCGELVSAHRRAETHTGGTRTLEFFIDRPAEPTFSQEWNNLHAKEVSVLTCLRSGWAGDAVLKEELTQKVKPSPSPQSKPAPRQSHTKCAAAFLSGDAAFL